jgi:antitoxin CptB
MTEDIDSRRRRAAYRAAHRGTKEMDWILGRFAHDAVPGMSAGELDIFETFLMLPDPELQQMIMEPAPDTQGRFAEIVSAVRAFHGLGTHE